MTETRTTPNLASVVLPGFSARQRELLAAPLDRAKVQTRQQSGRSLAYLEGWHVIAEANRIFGFDGWDRLTLSASCVAERERPVGRDRKSGWGVTYTARVQIVVIAGERRLIREGSGAGHGIDADLGLAHESALKEAETDATKRALMSFGNAFGLALYDKEQRQVSDTAAAPSGAQQPAKAEPADDDTRPVSAVFQAGRKAIAGATSLDQLQAVTQRVTARHEAGDLNDYEHQGLLQLLLNRETELTTTK